MTGPWMLLVGLPTLAAGLVAWVITDWRLSSAVAAGTAAPLFVLPGTGLGTFILPLLSGAAVGAFALAVRLALGTDVTLWSRLFTATIAALVAHILFLVTIG